MLIDDELIMFEAVGPTPLPLSDIQTYIEHDGAKIWYTTYNSGKKKKKGGKEERRGEGGGGEGEQKERGEGGRVQGEAGAGKKRAVVFLHGGLGNSENWGYQAPQIIHEGIQKQEKSKREQKKKN